MTKRKSWRLVLAIMATAGIAIGITQLPHTPHSPLQKEDRVQEMITSWHSDYPLVLPTYLPTYEHARSAFTTPNGDPHSHTGYIIDADDLTIKATDSDHLDLLEIEKQQRNHYRDRILLDNMYTSVSLPPLTDFETDTIRLQSSTPVKLPYGVGYWLHFQDMGRKGADYQVLAFHLDGIDVQLEGTLAQAQMEKVARSFEKISTPRWE